MKLEQIVYDAKMLLQPLPYTLKKALGKWGYVVQVKGGVQQIRLQKHERIKIFKAMCDGKEVVAVAPEYDVKCEYAICKENHLKRWWTTKEFIERFAK